MSNTTIIVGNGPSLLQRNLGETIDAHKHIVRCNDYSLNGYAEDTGKRTTHWAIGVWDGQLAKLEAAGMLPYNGGIELWTVTVCGKDPATSPAWDRLCKQTDAKRIVRISYGSLGPLLTRELFKGRAARGARRWPTTGLMAICEAMRRWPGEPIDLVGFWTGGSDKGHYYAPDGDTITPAGMHDYPAERRLIDGWVDEGRVRRL